jgi:signal transduction histidine kinase
MEAKHEFNIVQRKLLKARLTGTAQEQKVLEGALAKLYAKMNPLDQLDTGKANSIGSTYQIDPK